MNKHISAIENKDWNAIQSYIAHNKDQYLPALKAMKKYKNIDFKKMFMEDIHLFIFFFKNFSTTSDYDTETFWHLHNQAYTQLKKDGIIDINLHEDKINFIKQFEINCELPAFIPVHKLEKAIYKKDSLNIFFNYSHITRIIEKYYEIQMNCFFSPLESFKIKDIFSNYFPDYEEFMKVSPINSLEANYLSIISDMVKAQIPYINFWHDLIENDFKYMSNGSTSDMHKPINVKTNNLNILLDKKFHFYKCYVAKIKSIFFKELSQFEQIQSANKIKFITSW